MTGPEVQVLDDKAALVDRAAALTVERIGDAIARRGRCTIALSGGSTPRPVYEKIAIVPLDWDKLFVFWGDERYVPHDSPESNARMAAEAWLDRVPIPRSQIYRVPTDGGDPAADAARYESTLRAVTGEAEGVPALDIILLGMGDDGHTASLFPGTAVLAEKSRLIAVGNKDGQPRITFTFPLIDRGRWICFWVAGSNKQAALREIFAAAPAAGDRAVHYPASGIQPVDGQLLWLLDRDAAAGLPTAGRD